MNFLLASFNWVLAQGDKVAEPVKKAQDVADPEGFNPMMPAFIAIGLVFLFTMFRGPAKEKRKRQDLLKSLKKNDRVVTHTGIIGTIANVSNDYREITLKVEDSTRIKFVAHAIAGLYQEPGSDGKSKEDKPKDDKDRND